MTKVPYGTFEQGGGQQWGRIKKVKPIPRFIDKMKKLK